MGLDYLIDDGQAGFPEDIRALLEWRDELESEEGRYEFPPLPDCPNSTPSL